MKSDFSIQALSAGVLAAFVGFAGSFTVVVKGLIAVGASQAEAASALTALSIAMGVCGVILSLRTKMPISVAWSTPGGALLASTGMVEGGFAAAVGAFLVSGALLVASGLWRPLGRWVAAIPAPLANAMLAGVLFGFCLAPVKAVSSLPLEACAMIGTWLVVSKFNRLYAVPAAVIVTIIIVAMTPSSSAISVSLWPAPILITPIFSWSAVIGIAIPLFIVTMASQNIPGMAVLNVNGYKPAAGPLFWTTGLFSLLATPFGGHAVNLAAITAALCASPDAHPDPRRRYIATIVTGSLYVVFGWMAGAATAFISASPPGPYRGRGGIGAAGRVRVGADQCAV